MFQTKLSRMAVHSIRKDSEHKGIDMLNQRTALMIAAALTAGLLVLIGSVTRHISLGGSESEPVAAPEVVAAASQPTAAPSASPSAPTPEQAAPAQEYPVSPEQAIWQAVAVAPPQAQVLRAPELVDLQGTVAYEVPFDSGNVYVDATTGQVLASSIPTGTARVGHETESYEHDHHAEHESEEHEEYHE